MTTLRKQDTNSSSRLQPRERVVVTGVAGFIGSNLAVRLLDEGFDVTGVDDLSQGVIEQVPAAVDFHQLDIRDSAMRPLFRQAGAIFHLAAKNCISDCQADPVATASINVTGTVAVLEAARLAGCRRVIYAESSAVYEGSDVFPSREEQSAPQSFYAVSKFASRLFAEAYARFSGLELTALRYFNVYGPRQDYRRTIPPVMSAFILQLLQQRAPTIYGDGSKRRDFVHVDDVNNFHMLCLRDARTHGGTYNLGTGISHSVREIYQLIADILGSRIEPVQAPELPGEALETRADISAARALGWEPRVQLRSGLADMIDYLRVHVLAAEPELLTS